MAKAKKAVWDSLLIGLLFIVIAILYSPYLIDPVLLPKFTGWGVCLLLTGILSWQESGNSLNIKTVFLNNPILWALVAYLLISGLSLLETRNLADGFLEWFKGLFLLNFTILFLHRFSDKTAFFTKGLIIGMMLLSYFSVILGFYQFMQITANADVSHASSYAISGAFAHRNLYAEVLFMTLPFNIFGLWQYQGVLKWLSAGGALLGLFIIVILMSRAVWLSVISGIMVMILVFGFVKVKEGQLGASLKKHWPLIWKNGLVFLSVVIAAVGVYSQVGSSEAFRKQLVSIFQFNFTYGSIEQRINLWQKSLTIIQNNPFKGVGLGDWELNLLKQGNEGMLSANNKTFFQRPHNDYLWVFSESGVFALLAYLGIFAAAFYLVIHNLLNNPATHHKKLLYLMCFALGGYMTYAFFSFPKERIEHQIMLGFIFIMIGVVTNKESNCIHYGFSNRAQQITMGILILLTLCGTFLGVKRIQAERDTYKALKAREKQNHHSVIHYIKEAESPFYRLDPMSTPINWYSGSAYYQLGKVEQALKQFQSAYGQNPYHMHVVNNLATAYQKMHYSDSAIHFYEKALKLSPQFTGAALNLAVVYFQEERIDKALTTIRRVPYEPDNNKYKRFLTPMLLTKTKEIKQAVEEPLLGKVINGMIEDKQWLRNIYAKSLKEDRSFQKQILKDGIYSLEKIDESIKFEKAKQLKQKYL